MRDFHDPTIEYQVSKRYIFDWTGWTCTCPYYLFTKLDCEHIMEVTNQRGNWRSFEKKYSKWISKNVSKEWKSSRKICRDVGISDIGLLFLIKNTLWKLVNEKKIITDFFNGERHWKLLIQNIDIKDSRSDEMRSKVFSIIDKFTLRGKSVSFQTLLRKMKITEIELRSYISDLLSKPLILRIPSSDEEIYRSFDRYS